MSIENGDTVRFKVGFIKGLKAVVTAVSPRTGGLTTRMLESRGAYAVGDKVNCEPHEVERVTHHDHQFFSRDPHQPRDRLGTMDERCANCRRSFGEHYNGRCPLDEEEDA